MAMIYGSEVVDTKLPGKTLSFSYILTVPQTDTGGRDEYSKALEENSEKELGKSSTVTSGEGAPDDVGTAVGIGKEVKGGHDCLLKHSTLAKQ